jgi:hypothetical protein
MMGAMSWSTLAAPSRRPSGAVILLAAFALMGCALGALDPNSLEPSPDGSPARTAVASASAPALSPDPSPSNDEGGSIPHDSVAQVVTTDLVVRSEPGVHQGSEIYPARLNEPTLLYVVDGPVQADGFDWYLFQPFAVGLCVDVCPEPLPFGWVAQAGKDGEIWVAPGAVTCPPPTVAEIQWLSSMARLACYGDDVLEFRGKMGSCFSPSNEAGIPFLLVEGCTLYTDDYQPTDTFGPFGVALRFGGPVTVRTKDGAMTTAPMLGGNRVRVTGQFDHSAADECGRDPQLVLSCRAQFVATEIVSRD